jgi:hypothetical protein
MPVAFHATLAEMVALEEVTWREPSVTDTSGVPGADDLGGVGATIVEGVGAMDEGAVVVGAGTVVVGEDAIEVLVEGAVSGEGALVVLEGAVALVEGGVVADTGDATPTTPDPTHVTITTPVRPAVRHEQMA